MIQALPGKVLVHNMTRGEQISANGIIIQSTDKKSEGIRNRWAQVYSIGAGVDLIEGSWILIEHGRWSRELNVQGEILYLVDYPKGIMAEADEKPLDAVIGSFSTPTQNKSSGFDF